MVIITCRMQLQATVSRLATMADRVRRCHVSSAVLLCVLLTLLLCKNGMGMLAETKDVVRINDGVMFKYVKKV